MTASPDAEAKQRAVIAVSTYLGHLQLARTVPDTLPGNSQAWQRHLDTTTGVLILAE